MKPLKTTATSLLLLSLVASAQIPWDIEIIKAEAIGREPGFSHGFSPINSPNYFQLGRVTVEQADGSNSHRANLLKMLDYKTMKVTNLIVPMDKFPPREPHGSSGDENGA
jgi:hypothetical protein